MAKLDILNWQSRRATAPVARAMEIYRQRHPEVEITQSIRPLSGFEHQSMESVTEKHDIIIFDHPFCGAIAASDCFVPLDDKLPELEKLSFIGISLETYRFRGKLWGAPIDGATQNAIYRPDLLEQLGGTVPTSFDQVLELGRKCRERGFWLGTPIATPHALLAIFSYMANMGKPVVADDDMLCDIPADSFAEAYEAVRQVMDLSPPEARQWNSIELHEAMVARDDIVYAPLVYGYATYGEPDQRHRLGFAPFAGINAPYCAGTTIGGTAMGLSRHCKDMEAGLDFMRFMASPNMQDRVVAENNGQPAGLGGWQDAEIDARFNGFFSQLTETMNRAWIRPRFEGYVSLQRLGGTAIADALEQGLGAETARNSLLKIAGELNAPQASQ